MDLNNKRDIRKEINEFLAKQKVDDGIPDSASVGDKPGVKGKKEGLESINFDLTPIELEEYLNRYVVNQRQAVEVLSTKICTHFNRMKMERKQELPKLPGDIKNNILMIGNTGVGKTYIIKLIADKLGVPFVKADATKFSETGYVGGDVEDLVRELVQQAKGNLDLAEYGIIYLDEIDKIARANNAIGIDVSRSGVQRNLLKLMEEAEVDLKVPHDIASQMEAMMQVQRTGKFDRKKINTKNILFIVSGAFTDIVDIIRRRLRKAKIGFMADHSFALQTDNEILKQVATEDLIEFGYENEFIGRLPVITVLNDLDKDSLYQILTNYNASVVLSKIRDFASYGIDLEFDDEVLRYVSEKALEEKTGARGLVRVLERITVRFEKILPSTSLSDFKVSLDTVKNPDDVIDVLLVKDAISSFIDSFKSKHGINMNFTEKAIAMLTDQSMESGQPLFHICQEMFKDYEYGLKLIQLFDFTVSEEVLNNPKEFLDNLIKANYEARKSSQQR